MNIHNEILKIKKQCTKVAKEENTRDEMFRELFEKIKCDHDKTIAIVKTAKYEMAAERLLEDADSADEEGMASEFDDS